MSGLHARVEQPSRPGLAVVLLGLVGLTPPVLILAPHAATDALSALPASSAPDLASQALTAAHTAPAYTCRCGDRTIP